MKTLAIAAASIGLAFSAAPAFAANDAPTASISVADLDLSTVEGQKALDRRIDRVARSICGAPYATGSRVLTPSARRCIATAKASAAPQVAAMIQDQQRGG